MASVNCTNYTGEITRACVFFSLRHFKALIKAEVKPLYDPKTFL